MAIRIDGRALAQTIYQKLSQEVSLLKEKNITPTLGIILVGNDPGSLAYIKQKQKAAELIGASVIFKHLPAGTSRDTLESTIAHCNTDSSVHGIIVQRPVPIAGVADILNTVAAPKDVDGFIPHSPFEVPVARAIVAILTHIHTQLIRAELNHQTFKLWLNSQSIAVIGRGETAGGPIAETLSTYDCSVSVIHSQTEDPETILKNATVIISCVGKKGVIKKHMVTPGVILISVGLTRDKEGKLHGDYDVDNIKDTASFYTPTPGGVGPVNVSCLMQNLVDACIMSIEHIHSK